MDSPKIDPVCVQVEVCAELCFPSGDYNLKNRVMFRHHCNLITGKRDLLEASAEAHVHGQIGSLILWVLYTMAMSYRLSTLIIHKTNEVSLVASFFSEQAKKVSFATYLATYKINAF